MMTGPFKDKENAEVKTPNKGKKRGPKNEGLIMITSNMIEYRNLMRRGIDTSVKIAKHTDDCIPAVSKVLERMIKIGMIERVDISDNKRKLFKYTVNNNFSDDGNTGIKPIF